METGKALAAEDLDASTRCAPEYDAVVLLGMGLAGRSTRSSGPRGEDRGRRAGRAGVISDLRQATDLTALPVGRNVVVIGGGMTAIDAAVQSKLLGAETVTLLYRRGREAMPASRYEQDLAASRGVRFVFNAMPVAVLGNGAVTGVRVEYTRTDGNTLLGTGETFDIPADQVLKAIGQTLTGAPDGLEVAAGTDRLVYRGRVHLLAGRLGRRAICSTGRRRPDGLPRGRGRDAAMDIHVFPHQMSHEQKPKKTPPPPDRGPSWKPATPLALARVAEMTDADGIAQPDGPNATPPRRRTRDARAAFRRLAPCSPKVTKSTGCRTPCGRWSTHRNR